jgi:gliding motility-associated-like protein
MTRTYTLFVFLFCSLLSTTLQAQSNDECSGATVISDPTDFCTPDPGDNNALATPSTQAFPSCWGNVGADLWYVFTAVASNAIVTVKGQTPSNPTGTAFGPQVAVYSGDCNNLTEIACAFDQNFVNTLPLLVQNLVVGQQYYIRVDAVIAGSFQLCLENLEIVNVVSGDCPTAAFICGKQTLEVSSVFNAGIDPNEINNAACFQGLGGESSSAWYVFTAANAGNLEFTITPNDPLDDIDFVLYRLPNGPGDCTGKISERCMAAGDFLPTSPCMGPTGLNATATDVNQPPGCAPGQDNFLRFLTMVPGTTYALVINNFTTLGSGFTLEWGGTAIFQGESNETNASFSTNAPDQKICLGEALIVSDSSTTSSGSITDWLWDFGSGASPDTTSGVGPHTIQYQTPGPKSIVLAVITDEGCASLDTAFLLVEACCVIETEVSVTPGCPQDSTATPATATVEIFNGIDPLTINWSNGQMGDTITIDSSGTYTVYVEDALGCMDSMTFVVNTPLDVAAMFPPDTTILQGESVTLGVTGMPSNNLLVWWIVDGDTLVGAVQALMPDETTSYLVIAYNNGCEFSDSLTVTVREPRDDIPNAFTPNGDSANDTFGPVFIGFELVQLEVWSRWGDKVFDSLVEGRNTWDGTVNGLPAPSDVYVYRIRFLTPEGTAKVESGDVTLLR